ncbi:MULTISPECIES: helix-turn-helix transcriptional regulator [unclassified Crossiella]|uniref:helix-turn-helix domain-containing protein n=1 Tax=unclassified Crossiella TaxID=2620835 RepID=UPI0020000BF5|nr:MULTISPECIES: helix-turn-helix transcriptional regulator [unclassified Crossiella]MCK2236452.1 helix-turn-helix domain-containing protein [Crossiella sp. S99.2]MCK2250119.1 helix-turn-helix domain-containing protein [Crossiella sp. S99.1]
MAVTGGAADFAGLLAALKARTNRSYAALAKRVGLSSSTLHRYCTGTGLPPSHDLVQRLGRACGASRAELAELHAAWLRAHSARELPVPQPREDEVPVTAHPAPELRFVAVVTLLNILLAVWGVLRGMSRRTSRQVTERAGQRS